MKMSFWNKSEIRIYIFLLFAFVLTVYSLFPEKKNQSKFVVEEIEYKTEYIYKDNIPNNIKKVITPGVNGLANIETNTNNREIVIKPVNEVVEVGTAPVGEYVGTLTGYGPDCKGCTGKVYCKNREGTWHNLYNDGITYKDTEYGEVRILAADTTLFPCGTVIEFSNDMFEPTIGIILDTGSTMKKAWKNNKVAIDLAFSGEEGTHIITNKNTKFSVKRWGW